MAELKTKKNGGDIKAFIASVQNSTRRSDAEELLKIMRAVTSDQGSMWGESLVGFGSYNYTYKSGHSGTWFAVGFSPRKQNTVMYIMPGFEEQTSLLERLGKHKIGKSCLYINKLADVDLDVLRQLISMSFEKMTSSDEKADENA
ncbi:DUF1801 domain-containing protein [Candidatus Lucifugimonas marina]|uniref:DUF1801 domain-containing protein n=1 Tax=Candidatus Lucifugimonas marina TaxID=3038979 RepID=A0AAJ6CUL9_9CHLR|nr:DUF1801 domain-containing protein [SAR202 cluster bacterium JH702]MDG0868305.1 DUF1801 domain-containing protein [SAR202 cluster bacterium JH639]WFG34949.1 DUF1801 domain-containing protein [SAR202 cluster bacterium JH545]WFG38900.1 DUF1801 domain-containing protein [SAR202 cluster bacterium JH1073]